MNPHTGEDFPSPPETDTANTPETFYEAYKEAQEAFFDIPFEPDFQQICKDRKIDPDDTLSPRYWSAVADFAHRKVVEQREAGVPEKSLVVKELAASVPDTVYSDMYLSTVKGAPRSKTEGALRAVSHFNGLIMTAADLYPEVTPDQMKKNLIQIANISPTHPAVLHESPTVIGNRIRGAQKEKQHNQILEATDLKHRDTDVGEDVYRGADKVAYRTDGSAVRINFKASRRAIKNLGVDGTHAYDERGVLIVGMINNEEAGNSFHLDPNVAAEKATELRNAIQERPVTRHERHLQVV